MTSRAAESSVKARTGTAGSIEQAEPRQMAQTRQKEEGSSPVRTVAMGKSSLYRGVTLFRPTGKWRAQVSSSFAGPRAGLGAGPAGHPAARHRVF